MQRHNNTCTAYFEPLLNIPNSADGHVLKLLPTFQQPPPKASACMLKFEHACAWSKRVWNKAQQTRRVLYTAIHSAHTSGFNCETGSI